MVSAADVLTLLGTFYVNGDGEARKSVELIRALLAWSPEPFSRQTFTPGHVTCTGVVLSPARDAVLLVHHRRLDRWLLPGGHVEGYDGSPAETARREVLEETGAVLKPEPGRLVGVDVHPIPGRGREPLHLHHDLIFGFQAQALRFECSVESRAVTWCGLEEFDRYDLPGSIRRSVERARQF